MTTKNNPTYNSWQAMKARCCKPSSPDYSRYGGRGITVCDRWLNSYQSFLEDMGERPLGLTLDRIDTNGNYQPDNCRWANNSQQMLSRRFFTAKPRTSNPYVYQRGPNCFRVMLQITSKNQHRMHFKTREEAEAHRDICVFERDFLKLRGLTYD